MSRQIQFRRGTADEHATFTGAEGEITVDTTNKTIRVHDGTTPGGTMLARQSALDAIDYVIAWQTPTADNNYTWYCKYKSGWVEQGGIAKIATTNNRWAGVSVSFPIKMATSMYTAPRYIRIFEDPEPYSHKIHLLMIHFHIVFCKLFVCKIPQASWGIFILNISGHRLFARQFLDCVQHIRNICINTNCPRHR